MKKWDNLKTEELAEAVLALKSQKETRIFLRDLLTEKEILELGNRWKAVQMLDDKISYARIEKETGLSSTTIARISKWLKSGMGGYKLVLERLRAHHNTLSRPRKG